MATTPTKTSGFEYFQCSKCQELKDLSEFTAYFYKEKLMHRNDCKTCQSLYNSEHHKLLMSLPQHSEKRQESLRKARSKYYNTHKDESWFRQQERIRHKKYREKLKGYYFLEIEPIVPVAREFDNMYGLESITAVTGLSNDFFRKMFNGDYNVVRVDVADTVLTRLNGPPFTLVYDGKKRYFLETNHGKFLGRKIDL